MSAEQRFEGDISRTTGPGLAEAVVEFFKRNKKSNWLLVEGKFYEVLEVNRVDADEDGVTWSVWTKVDE